MTHNKIDQAKQAVDELINNSDNMNFTEKMGSCLLAIDSIKDLRAYVDELEIRAFNAEECITSEMVVISVERKILAKENKKLRDALERISKKGHPQLNNTNCHWEGCNSPEIAQKALGETNDKPE